MTWRREQRCCLRAGQCWLRRKRPDRFRRRLRLRSRHRPGRARRRQTRYYLATSATAPTVTLSISPAQANNTYNPSAIVTITAKVVDPTGAGIPTGIVALYNSANYDELTPFPLASTGAPVLAVPRSSISELSSFTTTRPGGVQPRRLLQRRRHLHRRGPGNLLSVTSEQSPTFSPSRLQTIHRRWARISPSPSPQALPPAARRRAASHPPAPSPSPSMARR